VAIGSNTTTLFFVDVVSSLLSEEMGRKNMEGKNTDALFARGHSQERNRSKSSSGISKSKGIYKSLGKFVKVCWRCGKQRNCKKQCRSKSVERGKGFDDIFLQKQKLSRNKEGICTWILQANMHITRNG
jgi:hypothetical protein